MKAAKQTNQTTESARRGSFIQRQCDHCAEEQEEETPFISSSRVGRLQTKLAVGAPNDIYEQEADRIADQVMAMPAHDTIRRSPIHVQRVTEAPSGQTTEAPASVERALASPGQPLEPGLREEMEGKFGYDFSGVRVHTGGGAEQSARDVNAQAYTVGRNVVFGAGQFFPGTDCGRRLIAHELTHVVQQHRTGQHTLQRVAIGTPGSPTPTRLQRQVQGVSTLSDREYYLEVDPPSPIIWQRGATFTIKSHINPIGAGIFFRDVEWHIENDEGRRPWIQREDSDISYPARLHQSFSSPGRRVIIFTGRPFSNLGGAIELRPGDPVRVSREIYVASTSSFGNMEQARSTMERLTLISDRDEELLSASQNPGESLELFQRITTFEALQRISENKAQVISLRRKYERDWASEGERAHQVEQMYDAYRQVRRTEDELQEFLSQPYRAQRHCSPGALCNYGVWARVHSQYSDRLDQISPQRARIDAAFPELAILYISGRRSYIPFSLDVQIRLTEALSAIDRVRWRLVAGDDNLPILGCDLIVRQVRERLRRRISPSLETAIREAESGGEWFSTLLGSLSIAAMFLPGGAFVSALVGLGVGISQTIDSWEAAEVYADAHLAGIVTSDRAVGARSQAIWDTLYLLIDLVDFGLETTEVIRQFGRLRSEGRALRRGPEEGAVSARRSEEGATRIRTTESEATAVDTGPSHSVGESSGTSRGASRVHDAYEEERGVEMFGYRQTPDGLHEIEAYRHGIGRCSGTPGQFCPLIRDTYRSVLIKRSHADIELTSLQARIVRFTRQGEEVPQALMDRAAQLEVRLRNLEQVDRLSIAPSTYRIREVTQTSYPDVVPQPGTILEFRDGTRIWRDTHRGPIRHESSLREGTGRQHFEREHYSATEHGRRPTGPRYQRCHSLGQGTGFESPYGILDCPEFVNQILQNHGIEIYMRRLAEAAPVGTSYRVLTSTTPIQRTRRLGGINYHVEIVIDGQRHPFFDYRIEVSGPATHPTVVANPIVFSTNPAAQIHRANVQVPSILSQVVNRVL